MTKSVVIGLLFVGLTWLAYMCWLTGYQSGYEDGEARAWERLENPYFANLTTDVDENDVNAIGRDPVRFVQLEMNQ